MRFDSEEERLKHPYASLIPYALWKHSHLFNEQLSNQNALLMSSTLSTFSNNKICLRYHSSQNQLTAWLAILLRHSKSTADVLLTVMQNLSLPASITFQGAIITGRMDIVNLLELKDPDIIRAVAENQAMFAMAASCDQLSSLKWLVENFPQHKQAFLQADQGGALEWAARHGNLAMLNWFKEIMGEELVTLISTNRYRCFALACYTGQLDTLKWFEKLAPHLLEMMIKHHQYEPFIWACTQGHLAVAKWLVKATFKHKVTQMMAANNFAAFQGAATEGHYAIVRWLIKKTSKNQLTFLYATNSYAAFRGACAGNHRLILENLIIPEKINDMIEADNYGAFRNAACNGHFEILKRLKELAPRKFSRMVWANNNYSFRALAYKGRVDIMDWIVEQLPDEWVNFNHIDALTAASEQGQLNVLQWYSNKSQQFRELVLKNWIQCNGYLVAFVAAVNGHLFILEWIKEQFSDLIPAILRYNNYNLLDVIAQYGQKNILDWLVKSIKEDADLEEILSHNHYAIFHHIADKGHTAIFSYLNQQLSSRKKVYMLSSLNFKVAESAAAKGYIDILIEIHNSNTQHLSKDLQLKLYSLIFIIALSNQQVHVLMWLNSIRPNLFLTMNDRHKRDLISSVLAQPTSKCAELLLSNPAFFNLMEEDIQQQKVLESKRVSAHRTSSIGNLKNRIALANNCLRSFINRKWIFLREYPYSLDLIIHSNSMLDHPMLYYYILLHWIKRNEPSNQNGINYLLSIPAVNRLATAIDAHQENETLNAAVSAQNWTIVNYLIKNNKSLYELAKTRDFLKNPTLVRINNWQATMNILELKPTIWQSMTREEQTAHNVLQIVKAKGNAENALQTDPGNRPT